MSGSPIASRLPGRLRLRTPELRQRRFNETLVAEFARWDGVLSVEGNVATGGILLRYDAGRVDPAGMEARVVARLDPPASAGRSEASPEVPPGVPSETPAAGSLLWPAGSLLWPLNRPAKIGMLASLTASMLALTVGKKPHAVLGALHLAFLMIHLANHRRKLLQ
jgi:Heavy metal associated domain 2